MGKLGNQPDRKDFIHSDLDLKERVKEFQIIAKSLGVTEEMVASTEISMQINRLNAILIESGDKMDENLAGIGDIISSK